MKNKFILVFVFFFFSFSKGLFSQKSVTESQTSKFLEDTVRSFINNWKNLKISGYIQPQFQAAQSKGADSYAGGDFSAFSQSRFKLRRSRVKIEYSLKTDDNYPLASFVFQVDATERAVGIRDMFIKLYEKKGHNFSVTTGMFNRPFSFELNYSSASRESPERGRMSQILLRGQRDLGVMISYEPINRSLKNQFLKIDAGIFNGQGLSGPVEFDNHKDFISRLTIKPLKVKQVELSGGLSLLYGGWRQGSKYVYDTRTSLNGNKYFQVDSSLSNIGGKAPRHYYGADAQIVLKHGWGKTEWRGEYWAGKQPGTATTTSNPGTLPTVNGISAPTYLRNFDGAFLLFLQNIISAKHQLIVKYDWYDPNTKVKKYDIGKPGTNLTVADIKYSTLGLGYTYYFNENLKLILYYDIVKNERTQLPGYTTDIKDNIFTCRLQFRF